jgi:hypothetical protein
MAEDWPWVKGMVFIHDGKALVAYDVMNREEVSLWLKGQRK